MFYGPKMRAWLALGRTVATHPVETILPMLPEVITRPGVPLRKAYEKVKTAFGFGEVGMKLRKPTSFSQTRSVSSTDQQCVR